jgi:transcriptional regulator GlxA family with amidase domain
VETPQARDVTRPICAAILLFDGVEVLDFAAPFEVFSLAGTRIAPGSLQVTTLASRASVSARNGLVVNAQGGLSDNPDFDVVVLPGGPGVERVLRCDPEAVRWIQAAVPKARCVLSICSGALFLASGGWLKQRRASTHHSDLELLRTLEPSVEIVHGQRYVVDGPFVTSDGISAGLDASLFVVDRLLGTEVASATAAWMEYHSDGWRPRPESGSERG